MKKALISIDLNIGKYDDLLRQIINLSISGSSYVCFANVHMLVLAYFNREFANVVNRANYVTTDGVPLKWGLRWLYGIKQDRVAGMDLLPDIFKEAERRQIPILFYGGTEELAQLISRIIPLKYPNLKISGIISPPFRKLSVGEQISTADRINISGAKIVIVCLGCPKQEVWMSEMMTRINASMIGIGGALPVLLGLRQRAPIWVQKYGLEWLFRLYQEPQRLIRRYAFTNCIFICLILREFFLIRVIGRNRSAIL